MHISYISFPDCPVGNLFSFLDEHWCSVSSSPQLCTISRCQSTRGGHEGWPVWNLADKADLTIRSNCVGLWNCAEQLVHRSKVDVEWWSVLCLSKLCLCRVIYNLNIKSCRARDSWNRFSKSNLCLNTFQQKKLLLSAVFQTDVPSLTSGFYLYTIMPMKHAVDCVGFFFSLYQTVEHGFPHQPSALGYSPFLRLMAIGTRSGAIKLYAFQQLCLDFSDHIRMCNFKTL